LDTISGIDFVALRRSLDQTGPRAIGDYLKSGLTAEIGRHARSMLLSIVQERMGIAWIMLYFPLVENQPRIR